MVNVLIRQFHTNNYSYPTDTAIFLEEQLLTFSLERAFFGRATFSKVLLLISFLGTVVFGHR